jgi:hypothetical protein
MISPLNGTTLGEGKPCAADGRGQAVLPDSLTNGPKPGYLLVTGTVGDESAASWLAGWQLAEAALRGAKGVSFTSLTLDLPNEPIDHTTNWATGHAPTAVGFQSENLAALTSPDGGDVELSPTPVVAGQVSALTLDLNRDRILGEVQITFDPKEMWAGFAIQVYGTGDSLSDAFDWAKEPDVQWAVASRGKRNPDGSVTLRYHPASLTARFIRIVPLGGGAARIKKIDVFSPVVTGG